jgi:hypothetical protein
VCGQAPPVAHPIVDRLAGHDELAAVAVQHGDPQADAAQDARQGSDGRISTLTRFQPPDGRLAQPAELGEFALAEHVPAPDLAQHVRGVHAVRRCP